MQQDPFVKFLDGSVIGRGSCFGCRYDVSPASSTDGGEARPFKLVLSSLGLTMREHAAGTARSDFKCSAERDLMLPGVKILLDARDVPQWDT